MVEKCIQAVSKNLLQSVHLRLVLSSFQMICILLFTNKFALPQNQLDSFSKKFSVALNTLITCVPRSWQIYLAVPPHMATMQQTNIMLEIICWKRRERHKRKILGSSKQVVTHGRIKFHAVSVKRGKAIVTETTFSTSLHNHRNWQLFKVCFTAKPTYL